MSHKGKVYWTFAITSVGVFMVTLDNLVVTTALPGIREDLHASIENLEWTVNAYALTFAVLLLAGAALGDRFGRRRMFAIGLGIFTVASAAAALAASAGALIAARAFQGVGGAIVTPLTLTILSAGVPRERRGAFIGAWSGIAGLAVAFGPLFGGAVVSGISWHWIFWLNVPVGLVLIPLALFRLEESYGPDAKLDLPGVGLVSAGLVLQAIGLSWIAMVTSPTVAYVALIGPFILSGIGMALFWAPVANVVLGAVSRVEEGKASGTQNSIRELGGVFGVAVLASVWSHYGSYASGQAFVDGMVLAVWIGAAVVAAGAVAAFLIPARARRQEAQQLEPAFDQVA